MTMASKHLQVKSFISATSTLFLIVPFTLQTKLEFVIAALVIESTLQSDYPLENYAIIVFLNIVISKKLFLLFYKF